MKHQTQEQVETFEDFIKLESVQELLLNLQGYKHKNSKPRAKLGCAESFRGILNVRPKIMELEIIISSMMIT